MHTATTIFLENFPLYLDSKIISQSEKINTDYHEVSKFEIS